MLAIFSSSQTQTHLGDDSHGCGCSEIPRLWNYGRQHAVPFQWLVGLRRCSSSPQTTLPRRRQPSPRCSPTLAAAQPLPLLPKYDGAHSIIIDETGTRQMLERLMDGKAKRGCSTDRPTANRVQGNWLRPDDCRLPAGHQLSVANDCIAGQ